MPTTLERLATIVSQAERRATVTAPDNSITATIAADFQAEQLALAKVYAARARARLDAAKTERERWDAHEAVAAWDERAAYWANLE